MKEIIHKTILFIQDEDHPVIEVTSDIYQKTGDNALVMDIIWMVQNIDSDNDYEYSLVIRSDFIRVSRYRDVENEFGVRSCDTILDIENGNITFNNIIPVNIWDGIISILQLSNTKVNGIDVADYLSSYDIYRTRVA
jgi:hypothetical protein